MNLASELCLLLALGLVTSFVSGLFGIGGGIVRIPLFVYLLPLLGVAESVLMHVAVGTSVALIIPTAIAASVRQHKQGNLDLRFYRTWAVGIGLGVVAGNAIVPYMSAEIFKIIFVVFLLLVSVYVGFVPKTMTLTKQPPTGAAKIILAASVGFVALLTGTGGGALTTPSLKACNMPLKRAVAIASATGLVVGIIGTIGFVASGWHAPHRSPFSFGYVNLTVFFAMLPTILVGAPLGAKLNNHLSERTLSITYAAFLVLAAIDMAYKLIRDWP
jgi:uncharacterized membrane protein YfcA